MTHPARATSPDTTDSLLVQKLRALSMPLPAPTRESTPAQLAQRLLQEIDEILLPRLLTLRVDGTELAEFHVVQRALVQMIWRHETLPSPEVATPDAAATDIAGALSELIDRLPATAQVELTRRPAAVRPRATGCRLHHLEAALRCASPLDLLMRAQEVALACCAYHVTPQEVEHADPTSDFAPVMEAALARLRRSPQQAARGPALRLTAPQLHLTDLTPDTCLALATVEGLHLALVLPQTEAAALAQAWHRARG